jgi:hypothetical protein
LPPEQLLDKVLSDTNISNFRSFKENINNYKKTKGKNLPITPLTFNKAKSLENKTQYMNAVTNELTSLFKHKGLMLLP